MKLQEQAEIVRQRLEYFFRTVNGDFIIPSGLPFMKEFLNELDELLNMIEKE